jgi:hypothetical protein
MKSAIEVMTNVQSVRVPAFIVTSRCETGCDLVTDYSIAREKERRRAPRGARHVSPLHE